MIVGWTVVVLADPADLAPHQQPMGSRYQGDPGRRGCHHVAREERLRLQAAGLMIGGAIGGMAGMLLAIDQQNVTPDAYLPQVTFILYVIVILGGAGTILGPDRRRRRLLVPLLHHRRAHGQSQAKSAGSETCSRRQLPAR